MCLWPAFAALCLNCILNCIFFDWLIRYLLFLKLTATRRRRRSLFRNRHSQRQRRRQHRISVRALEAFCENICENTNARQQILFALEVLDARDGRVGSAVLSLIRWSGFGCECSNLLQLISTMSEDVADDFLLFIVAVDGNEVDGNEMEPQRNLRGDLRFQFRRIDNESAAVEIVCHAAANSNA